MLIYVCVHDWRMVDLFSRGVLMHPSPINSIDSRICKHICIHMTYVRLLYTYIYICVRGCADIKLMRYIYIYVYVYIYILPIPI